MENCKNSTIIEITKVEHPLRKASVFFGSITRTR